MLRVLNLEDILAHCRIDPGSEDRYVYKLGETAEEMVENYLNRSLEDMFTEHGGSLPRPVRHACYMIVAELYRNREITGQMPANVNPIILALLKPYKRLL